MSKSLTLIHIGKCGGSYLTERFPHIKSVHMFKPQYRPENQFVIWVRNPLSRFVSAFNHSKTLIKYDANGLTYNQLFNDPNNPFYKLKNKIIHKLDSGIVFNEWKSGAKYQQLMSLFDTANDLAEALSDRNWLIRRKAKQLIANTEVEHMSRGIGWYLFNGQFIKKYHKDILMVGRQEYMEQDTARLCELLHLDIPDNSPIRQAHQSLDKTLSDKAKANLKQFYAKTDFKALKALHDYGFIDLKTLKEYQQ